MWLERRSFSFNNTSTTTSTSNDDTTRGGGGGGGGGGAEQNDQRFVTCMDYVAVPFSSDEEWKLSAGWYIRDDDDFYDQKDEDWRLVTPQCAEYFLLGWSDGAVERRMVVPSGMRWRPSEPATSSLSSSLPPCREVEELYRQKGQVMALKTLGTLIGSVSCGVVLEDDASAKDGKDNDRAGRGAATATVASSHPLRSFPAQPIHLPHHHHAPSPSSSSSSAACTPRSILLWEGRRSWGVAASSSANTNDGHDDEEASMVYVFIGDEQGRVRLWRVTIAAVVDRPTFPDGAPFELIAVFGCVLHGNIGDAPVRSHVTTSSSSTMRDHLAATATFQSRSKLLCLALDGGDDEAANGDEDGLRLLAGTDDRKLFVWDLSTLSNKRHPAQEWGGDGGSSSGGGEVSEPSSTTAITAAGAAVAAQGSAAEARTFTNSKLFQTFVWVSSPSLTTSPSSAGKVAFPCPPPQAAEAKRQKRVTALAASHGSYVGQVVNCKRSATTHNDHSGLLYTVSFDVGSNGGGGAVLSKPMDFELRELQVMHTSTLAFLADDRGAVFSVASLSGGLVVSGGADGNVKLWCWNVEAQRYLALPTTTASSHAPRRRDHGDLITCVGVLCPPSTFFSTSLDGYVKTWRLRSTVAPDLAVGRRDQQEQHQPMLLLGVAEESSLLVRPTNGWWSCGASLSSTPATSMPVIAAGECAPVASACVHREFGALFVALHMTTQVRTYTFLDADTCAVPSDRYAHDGTRTVALAAAAGRGLLCAEDDDDAPSAVDGGVDVVGVGAAAPDDLGGVFAALDDDSDDSTSSGDEQPMASV
jgi:WD40 repeat protein